MFTPSQIKTTVNPNTFTAQDASLYSNPEIDQFWKITFFKQHSDTTHHSLGKALSSCISADTSDYSDAHKSHNNPDNTLRIGLHDKLFNLTPIFTST